MGVRQVIDSQAEWEEGSLWQVRILNGKLELGIATAASEVSRVEDTTAEFGDGTLSGVKAVSNLLQLVNTPTLQFNGSSTYVWLGNLTALKVSKPRLKAWFRTSSSSVQVIVRWRLHGPRLDMQSGKVRFVIGRTDFTATIVTSPSTYNDGKWHLAEGYFNGSTAYLWVDGTQVASASCSGIGYGDGGAAIGRDGDSSGAYFSGDIAYVEWLNDSTLVKRWKLDEGSDSKAYDQGGSYYNIYNGSWRTNYFNYETNQGTDAWRISPAWGGHEVIDGSEISWSTTLPTGTSIKVYTGINNSSSTPPTSWTQATSGNAISGAGAGADLTGKYIWVKAVLTTTDASATPKLNSLTIKVTRSAKRYAKGTWRNPPLDLATITEAAGSLLTATATAPAGTTIIYRAGISTGNTTAPETWATQTLGQAISVITQGADYTGKYLWIEIELQTTDVYKTSEVDKVSEVVGQHDRKSITGYADQFRALAAWNAGRFATGYAAQAMGRVTKTFDLRRAAIGFDDSLYGLSEWLLRKWERVWVPLGVFWSGDWHAPEDAVYAKTTGRDRLELLRSTNYSTSQVIQNTTLYHFALAVLQGAGLSAEELWVDTELQEFIIPYLWAEPLSHRELLRKIAEACLGQVYCDRNGVLRIEGPSFLATKDKSELEITMDDYFKKDNPVRWSEIANHIEVETQPLLPEEMQEIYRDNEPVSIAAGQPVSMTIMYNHSPCINPAARLEGADEQSNPPPGCGIEKITYYAWGADVKITSPASGTFVLVIEGQPLKVMNQQKIVARDEDSIKEHGVVQHTFPANPYVQTAATARLIADRLLASFKDPRRDLDLTWRGNPALELADRITVPDFKGTGLADFHVTQQTLDYTGGLRCTLKGRRAAEEEEK